jgi:hypothetical protein
VAEGRHPVNGPLVAGLCERSGDPSLRADLQALATRVKASPSTPPLPFRLVVAAADRGALEIEEAAALPGGRLLVALGEAGVRLLSARDATLAHFDVPAQRLVVSDHGTRALALARRGEAWLISRLDLASRTCAVWCEAVLAVFADSFDGSTWLVADEGDFLVIDTFTDRLEALWRVPSLPGRVLSIARSPESCAFVVGGLSPSCWRVELPGLVLRDRSDIPPPATVESSRIGVAPDGRVAVLGDTALLLLYQERLEKRIDLKADRSPIREPTRCGECWITVFARHDGLEVELQHQDGREQGTILLQSAERARARGGEEVVTLCDDRGRLLVCDPRSGALARSLRL